MQTKIITIFNNLLILARAVGTRSRLVHIYITRAFPYYPVFVYFCTWVFTYDTLTRKIAQAHTNIRMS
jgi:hypothetical protein